MKLPAAFFICTLLLIGCTNTKRSDEQLIHNYMAMSFDKLEMDLKHNMVIFEVRANENPTKYGKLLEVGREVFSATTKFSTDVDTLLALETILKSDVDSLFLSYTENMNSFQNVVSESTPLKDFIKDLSIAFHKGFSENYNLNLIIMKNQIAMAASEAINYLATDIESCGFRIHVIELAAIPSDTTSATTISLSSKLIQQFPHKYIFINDITQNGKGINSLKYKAETNTHFGQITFDSLPSAHYQVDGQVRGVAHGDRYYEEDFSYEFDVLQ